MILALDLGTKTGYAFSNGGGFDVHCSGVLNLAGDRFEGAGMRFLRFRRWLAETKPSEVYFEAVAAHKGTAAAHVYGGLMATMQAYCEENHVPYEGVPVGTIKRHATGKGNANKAAMIAAAREKIGYDGSDDNQADALWLLDYVIKRADQ